MLETNGYFTAWTIYLIAVIGAHGLLWWMLRKTQFTDFKVFLHLFVLSILITPATLSNTPSYWVPAFMAAFLDGLDKGMVAAIPRLISILGVFIVLICGSLLIRLYKNKVRKREGTKSTDEITNN